MDFLLICICSLVALGIVAALVSMFTKGGTDAPIVTDIGDCASAHDCSTCSSIASGECKIGLLMEEKKRQKGNKNEEREL